MPGSRDRDGRQAARKRGAAVLADLMTAAAVSSPAELARRSELAGVQISDQTVSNLLSAQVTARDSTVLKFITACLHEQDGNNRLAAERATAAFWKARFDDALGRAGDPAAGLVRIGKPPPSPAVIVDRPDVILVSAAVEAGNSVILVPTEGTDHNEPDQLDAALPDPAGSGDPVPFGLRSRVLSGMGGVGKSLLAAQYARQVWRDPSLDLLIWVSARSVDAVVSAYADAAAQLLGLDAARPEKAADRLMAWLSTTPRSWLIVLDDVQLPNQVQAWWPDPTESGQVIVTTRYRGEELYRPGRQVVEVGIYTAEQARSYLQHRLAEAAHLYQEPDGKSEPEDVLDDLARDLGRLPLALTHAAAYLLQDDIPIREYRALLADYRTRLGALFPHQDELPDADLATVATTWQISMDLATRLAPSDVVTIVMVLASLLDPDGIPRDVFTSDAILIYMEGVLGRAVSEREVWSAARVLHRLSLLTIDRNNPHREVQIHGLVQRAIREDPVIDPDIESVAWAVADSMLLIWAKTKRGTVLEAALRSNTQVLHAVTGAALWIPEVHPVVSRAGTSLGEAGFLNDAVAYFQHVHAAAHAHLGPDHPETLMTRRDLARWRAEAGDSAGAVDALTELLHDQQRVLGHDHPDTLTTRADLAHWHLGVAVPAGTDDTFTKLLRDQLQRLGPDHPDTLIIRANLANWRGAAGDPRGAVDALTELLPDLQRVLGHDHPYVLVTRHTIANRRGAAGDPTGAVDALTELLPDQQRILGHDHPKTVTTRINHAIWRGAAGDPRGAVDALTELLPDLQRVLGPAHFDTLAARSGIAYWRRAAGDPVGAAVAEEDLLPDLQRVLGHDHPLTLATRDSLARWREKAEDNADTIAVQPEPDAHATAPPTLAPKLE